MKKLLILAVVFLLILSSCSPREPGNIAAEIADDNGDIFRLANNNAVDFYFYYPENFIIDKNAAMISVFISDPDFIGDDLETGAVFEAPVNPNLSAFVFSMGADNYDNATQYWDEYMKPSYSETFKDIFIESGEDIEIAGLNGRKYIYTMSVGGLEYKFAQVLFIKNREVYTLTYTATPEKFDKHSRVMDVVVDTFEFK